MAGKRNLDQTFISNMQMFDNSTKKLNKIFIITLHLATWNQNTLLGNTEIYNLGYLVIK